MEKSIVKEYNKKQEEISAHLRKFQIPEEEYFYEFIFCLLTPQSNAQRCWQAVEELKKIPLDSKDEISSILIKKTRFHNNKSSYILKAKKAWNKILPMLKNKNRIELRNNLAREVKGYGLKEASHFLRNIGKSDNQIAILDRHILKNLKALGIIDKDKMKSKKHYLETESKFLDFSKKINVPIDALDILFWSKENGEMFK